MKPLTGEEQFACLALALGAAQFAVTGLFFRNLLRSAFGRGWGVPPPGGAHPAASVLVPCKGRVPGLREKAESMLRQDYPGEIEVLFVAPAESDPAYRELKAFLPEAATGEGGASVRGRRVRLLCSKAVPERCSEKVLNLLHALGRASPDSEVLLFADCDHGVPANWARDLAGALRDPSVGAATTQNLYVPARPGLGGLARFLWTGYLFSWNAAFPYVTGQSFAVRRRDFEELRIADLWRRCLCEDAVLDRELKRRGLRVLFAAGAATVSREPCSLRAFVEASNRWVFFVRRHLPHVWSAAALGLAAKAYILAWALRPPVSWGVLALLVGLDMADFYLVFHLLGRFLPDRFRDIHPGYRPHALWAGLAAPLVEAVYALNAVASVRGRDVAWGGYVYRVRGPLDVEVVGRTT